MQTKMREEFAKIFGEGREPEFYFAPGRVNLIGEHTDYNGGHVFPCALSIGTYALARKNDCGKMRFYSLNFTRFGMLAVEGPANEFTNVPADNWCNYPKGVMWAYTQKGHTIDSGLDILYYGNIPNGSGLSSSASIEVATAVILNDQFGFDVDMVEVSKICQFSENKFNGVNCGIMDQFAIAMGKAGHAIFLDTADLSYTYAPLELTEEEFDAIADTITDPVNRKRAKHAVYENQRTIRAVEALKNNDIALFGKLMNESHVSLRDDYEVTGIELDTLAETAWEQPGVIGSRMTGAGFGGCTVSIVEDDKIDAFIENVGNVYKDKIGYAADFYVVTVGDGAHKM